MAVPVSAAIRIQYGFATPMAARLRRLSGVGDSFTDVMSITIRAPHVGHDVRP